MASNTNKLISERNPPFRGLGGLILLLSFLLNSCTKEEKTINTETDKKPAPAITPTISLQSVNPTTVVQFKDSIVFNIKYNDGDGDIGFAEADSNTLYLTDTRKNLTEEYHIAPVAPIGVKIAVEGVLKIKLEHTILLSGTTTETTTYNIKLRDRSGHFSNVITCPAITINP